MFKSKRINLRKVNNDDCLTYHQWRNDIEVMESTSPNLDQYTLEDTQNFINMIINAPNAKGYIIEESNIPIGIISIINIDYKNRNGELIIDIGDKNMWNKGIASEAISLILEYVFNELNFHRLYLQVFDFNTSAIKLYEKFGFENEGMSKEALYRNGKWHNILSYSLLKKDYNTNN